MNPVSCALLVLLAVVHCSSYRVDYTTGRKHSGNGQDSVNNLSNEEARRIAVHYLREQRLEKNDFFRHRRLLAHGQEHDTRTHHGVCYFFEKDSDVFWTIMRQHMADKKIQDLLDNHNCNSTSNV